MICLRKLLIVPHGRVICVQIDLIVNLVGSGFSMNSVNYHCDVLHITGWLYSIHGEGESSHSVAREAV